MTTSAAPQKVDYILENFKTRKLKNFELKQRSINAMKFCQPVVMFLELVKFSEFCCINFGYSNFINSELLPENTEQKMTHIIVLLWVICEKFHINLCSSVPKISCHRY